MGFVSEYEYLLSQADTSMPRRDPTHNPTFTYAFPLGAPPWVAPRVAWAEEPLAAEVASLDRAWCPFFWSKPNSNQLIKPQNQRSLGSNTAR